MKCCDIFDVFAENNNLIKEYKHWKLLVRNRNKTLGNCVAITKKHHEALSDLTEDEMAEYALVSRDIEHALKKAFQYDKIHHLSLMFFDKHTHFHIIPRYKKPRKFAGMEWTDDFNPDPLIQKNPPVSQEILNKVKEEIKKHMT